TTLDNLISAMLPPQGRPSGSLAAVIASGAPLAKPGTSQIMSLSRQDCLALDTADPLAPFLKRFHRPEGLLYFDGNSLGMLSKEARLRAIETVEREWGEGLIESWTAAN